MAKAVPFRFARVYAQVYRVVRPVTVRARQRCG
jgi:hypothetical protein